MTETEGPGETELLALKKIDETSTKLQKQGNYLEALECMERGLVLRQHFFGIKSEQVDNACKVVGEMCNLLAMTYLQQGQYDLTLELLKKAEILTERDPQGKAVTYNNLACYYRKQGKLRNSLKYLQLALKIESKIHRLVNSADTHLNACAVLSQLGRHSTALSHAQSALILLQEELLDPLKKGQDKNTTKTIRSSKLDRIAVLAIAYHNVGVEQEFMKKYHESSLSYQKGTQIADKFLGPNHSMTITLKNSCILAKRAFVARSQKAC